MSDPNEPMSLARAITEGRKHKRMSQAELARTVGYSRRSLAAVEQGSAPAPISVVLKIADALGMSAKEREYMVKATAFMEGMPLLASGARKTDADSIWLFETTKLSELILLLKAASTLGLGIVASNRTVQEGDHGVELWEVTLTLTAPGDPD